MRVPHAILVAMATFQRPLLLRALLPKILDQVEQVTAALGPMQIDVLVVDNDPTGSGEAAVAEVSDPRISYVSEPRPGISAARNRILDQASSGGYDVIVFIDDDETPRQGWLRHLVQTYAEHDCAAVAGPVHEVFEDGAPDPWIRASGSYLDARHAGRVTGAVVPRAATNNLLLDTGVVSALGLRFDERFGLSGGEDSLFTGRLTGSGARIVWCAEAIVDDIVPHDRNNRAFALHRRRAQSNTTVRVDLILSGSTATRTVTRWALWGLRGIRQLTAGAVLLSVGKLRGNLSQSAQGERRIASGAGVLDGCAARPTLSYGTRR